MKFKSTVLGLVLMGLSGVSQATLIDFDSVAINNNVNDSYLTEGVQFQTDDWLATNMAGESSPERFAVALSGASYVNILDGFTDQITFTYGAFADAVVNVFDGENGTGSLLGSIDLAAHFDFANFDPVSLGFTGIGRSISLQSQPGVFAWDNLEFSNTTVVSAPAGITLLALGLALAYRRKKS
jgi:hypothetical protein